MALALAALETPTVKTLYRTSCNAVGKKHAAPENECRAQQCGEGKRYYCGSEFSISAQSTSVGPPVITRIVEA
jgi:hypothetical protein